MQQTPLAPTVDDRAIWDNWLSVHRLPVMTVHDELGTFDALIAAPMTNADLANTLSVEARALAVHLGLLAAMGLVEKRAEQWQATNAARTWLDKRGDGYWGPLLAGYRLSQPLHAQMRATLDAKPSGHGSNINEWERGELPQDTAHWIASFMNAHSVASSMAVARQPVFGAIRSLLDVGGGSGIFAIELARRWPALKTTILDIDTMCIAAQAYIDKSNLGERVNTAPVDMFRQPWPQGHDALFFSNIFHDWSEDTCRLLAGKAFAALPAGGQIMLHEMLMDDDCCGPATTASFSMLMLLGTRGRQYSFSELRTVLAGAGFVDITSVETGGGYYSLVLGRKPE